MDFSSFVEDNAVLDIDRLANLEGKPIWIVIVSTFNAQDFYSAKVPWIHDGIFDHRGNLYQNNFNPSDFYICRNKENHKEYLSVYDFISKPMVDGNFNLLFDDEGIADALINTVILTRSQTNKNLQKIIDKIVYDRSFAIMEKDNYSIFDMISVTDEILINLIPKII